MEEHTDHNLQGFFQKQNCQLFSCSTYLKLLSPKKREHSTQHKFLIIKSIYRDRLYKQKYQNLAVTLLAKNGLIY